MLPEGSDMFYLRCWVGLVGAVALFNGFHCYMDPEYTRRRIYTLQPKEGGCGSLLLDLLSSAAFMVIVSVLCTSPPPPPPPPPPPFLMIHTCQFNCLLYGACRSVDVGGALSCDQSVSRNYPVCVCIHFLAWVSLATPGCQ